MDRPTISAVASSRSGSTTTKAGEFWVFAYLFAKKDRANIDDDELLAFPEARRSLPLQDKTDLEAELEIGALLEIDHGD